ncbi:MAG TPA: hypothetical protein VJO52_14095 [Gemmatimonadaceae bacterium]|nr:hypothetical protein [Gemmatimonadaceae bacterium]
MIHFLVARGQDTGISKYLSFWGLPIADRFRVIYYDALTRESEFAPGLYVLAALDQLGPQALGSVRHVQERLEPAPGFRFFNHSDPARTLRRYDLLAELHRQGRNSFRAERATANLDALRYPVFVRSARAHFGALSPLLHSPREVDAAIGHVLVQGYSIRDLLVVEFCDTADAAGNYRKYAAFIVGDRIIPRSLACGREWMLKFHSTDFSRALVEEERAYVIDNPHAIELTEIFRVAGVQYGRIDYALRDGRIETWEINLNPTIGRGAGPSSGAAPAELEPIRRQTKEHFYRAFQAAWEAVDQLGDPAPAVHVQWSTSSARDAGTRWLDLVRTALRPAKPLLAPVVHRASPIIGRLARRMASTER